MDQNRFLKTHQISSKNNIKICFTGFVPLTVDYRQKAAAAGRIPTNFLRRELGPSDKEILTARVIDRSIRPLFPKSFTAETQIVANLLAVDGSQFPDIVALNSASAALAFSPIPWNGPIGAVRVGYHNNQFIINPTRKENSSLNLIVAGTPDKLTVMLEAEASNLDKNKFIDGISAGLEVCQSISKSIAKEASKRPKRPVKDTEKRDANLEIVKKEMSFFCEQRLLSVYSDTSHDKVSRDKAAFSVRDEAVQELRKSYPEMDPALFYEAFNLISR